MPRVTPALLAAAAALAIASSAHAVPVPYISLDIGPNGQRVEPGFTGVTSFANGTNGAALAPTALVSGTGDAFTLGISSVDWRDRGNSSNGAASLVQLGEDFVKNNAGDITLTLSGLDKGLYTVNSYHRDPDFDQSNRIQVFVTDDISSGRLQPTRGNATPNLGGVNNLTTANVDATKASFSFYSNGVDPVLLRFNGTVPDTELPLNGLTLTYDLNGVRNGLTDYALIDLGSTAQRLEPGALALPGAPAAGANNTNLLNANLLSDTGDAFTVSVSNLDQNGAATGGIDWRDRGDSPNAAQPLVQLAEDLVKNNQGVIRVTLGDLAAGLYRIESYHLDPLVDQSGNIGVYVTDADGTNVLQALNGNADYNLGGNLANLTTDAVLNSASAFFVRSNGVDDVVLIFDGRAFTADLETPLNGLRIQSITATAVPEPAAAATALLGLAALLIRRRA